MKFREHALVNRAEPYQWSNGNLEVINWFLVKFCPVNTYLFYGLSYGQICNGQSKCSRNCYAPCNFKKHSSFLFSIKIKTQRRCSFKGTGQVFRLNEPYKFQGFFYRYVSPCYSLLLRRGGIPRFSSNWIMLVDFKRMLTLRRKRLYDLSSNWLHRVTIPFKILS